MSPFESRVVYAVPTVELLNIGSAGASDQGGAGGSHASDGIPGANGGGGGGSAYVSSVIGAVATSTMRTGSGLNPGS